MRWLRNTLFFVVIIVLTIMVFVLIAGIQEMLFVPKNCLLWVIKPLGKQLVFIYELYLFVGFSYIFNEIFREKVYEVINAGKDRFSRKYRKPMKYSFFILNILLLYIIVTDVAVVTNKKIIDYSFINPKGKEYNFVDIVKINTGVYGKKAFFPNAHTKGDFFYIVELRKGPNIDLAEVGGVYHDNDERFVIEKLDKELVNMNIPKEASIENFQYAKRDLAKIYTDKIRNIIKNTN